jgi:hypothetical protein
VGFICLLDNYRALYKAVTEIDRRRHLRIVFVRPQIAIKFRTLLGGNCASVTAAGANLNGATVALVNRAAPTSRHLDLMRIPHLVIACNRLAECACLRQFCCAIPNSVNLSWIKSRACVEKSPARNKSKTITTSRQTETALCRIFQILPRLPGRKSRGNIKSSLRYHFHDRKRENCSLISR